MGWGNIGEINGREAGYNIEAICDEPGCETKIHRGLSYACGDYHGASDWFCDEYFCSDHHDSMQLCNECSESYWSLSKEKRTEIENRKC